MARINADSKAVFLGYFENERDAAEVYNAAAIEHYKEYARLNEIKD